MKRLLIACLLLGAAVGGALFYTAAARERDYRRLIAEGDAAAAADQPVAAIEAFSGAIALKADSMLAYLKRGEVYRRRGELGTALRDLRTACRLDPTATRPLEQAGDVEYALGRYERAAERFASYVRLDDRSSRLLYKLALARFRAGTPQLAITPLRQALTLNDRFAEGFYLLGLCLRDVDRTQDAVSSLQRAIQLSPVLLQAREALAGMHRLRGELGMEIDQLAALAALEPARPERQMALGVAYARAGRPDLAVLSVGRAVERHPDQAQLYVALGRIWLDAAERGDRAALEKALEALQESAAGAAPTSESLTLLGRAQLLAGNVELAERLLQQAVELFPVESSAFRQLADAAERRGHVENARDALISYQMLTGRTDAETLQTADVARIADLSLRLNEPAIAVAWLRRVADRANADASLLGRLADAEWRAGNNDAARVALHRALAQDPADPTLIALQRRLGSSPPQY